MNDTPRAMSAALPEKVRAALNISSEDAPLVAQACRVFGINPDPELQPRELANFRIYGDAALLEARSVVLVTCGGRKLRYPIDERTEQELRYQVFRAYKKAGKHHDLIEELPLPADLRLPWEARTGIPRGQAPERPTER
jgi:hypothetical protein